MSDKLISGKDDISGREVIASKDIWPEGKWKPAPAGKEAIHANGLYQGGLKKREARIPPMPNGAKPELVTLPDSWPGVTLTEVGAIFDSRKVTRETWVSFGRWAGAMNARSKLWVADWVHFGEREDWAYSIDQMMAISGLEYETIKSYRCIGKAVPVENRVLGPKPSFYAAVAPLPYMLQKVVLERAKAEGLNRDALRTIAKPYKDAERERVKALGLANKGGRPAAQPPVSLGDDMAIAAGLPVMPAQLVTPLEFEGGMKGALAFLNSLPENTQVKITVTAID